MSFKFSDKIIFPDDPTATPERVNQYREYYAVKYQICRTQQPKLIAEIGVRAGYSAWAFLQAAPNAKYIGFDANNGSHGGAGGEDGSYAKWAANLLKDYTTEFIELDTQTATSLDIENVDFFHVDGDHTYHGVKHDLKLALGAINQDGLILVDDISYLDEVRAGVNDWLDENKTIVKSEFISSLRGEMLIRLIDAN